MRHLSLVKKLSRLKEEQEYADEVALEHIGVAFTRGSVVELTGEPSAGKTSLMFSLLSKLTQTGEICAVVDSANSFDPCSAVSSGVEIENLLWVKCGGDLEKAFMAADYLVQAKGFGVIWLDLNGLSRKQIGMVPKTYWYRYRTRIKETPTVFMVTTEDAVAGSASQQSFLLSRERTIWSGEGRFKLLRQFLVSLHSRKQFYGEPIITRLQADY